MNVGVIVEGPDDVAVYTELLRRIDGAVERVYPRDCGGRHRLRNKFVVHLKEFAANPVAFGIRRAFIIRDSDCQDARPLEQDLQRVLTESGYSPPFSVSFHATKCKLESWLLADEEAISTVSMRRGGPGGMARIEENLETFREADQLYSTVLSRVGLQDTAQVMKEIVQNSRLEKIAERCAGFREFIKKVRSP